MCDICKASREKVEAFITEEMQANADAHDADYRESDDVRLIIDILIRKFYSRGALHLLPKLMQAAILAWAQDQAEAEAQAEFDKANGGAVVLSPAPKTVQ